MQALSQALLDIRVGEVQAALEGREPTPPERNDDGRATSRAATIPNFDRHLHQQIAAVGPQVQRRACSAMNRALPAMMQALERGAAVRIDRGDREYARSDLSRR